MPFAVLFVVIDRFGVVCFSATHIGEMMQFVAFDALVTIGWTSLLTVLVRPWLFSTAEAQVLWLQIFGQFMLFVLSTIMFFWCMLLRAGFEEQLLYKLRWP